MTTTRPPILTGPPPALQYCPNSVLPTVRWSIRMLEWVGWTYEATTSMGTWRSYNMIDAAGLPAYMTTYGLRRMAMEMWLQYGVKVQRNFVHPLSGF